MSVGRQTKFSFFAMRYNKESRISFVKRRAKGIILFVFLGGIMATSGVVIGISGVAPNNVLVEQQAGQPIDAQTATDDIPNNKKSQFCGSGNAKSTTFVQEFSIPTICTSPLAIVTDYDGNVWFTQTNTGQLAKFDPLTEQFTEYDNPLWPTDRRSMMWGIDYAPDGYLWFTDEAFDSIWRFSPSDEKYDRLGYPTEGNSLPQKLRIVDSQIIVNDFTGNKITFLDPNQYGKNVIYLSIPSPVDNSVTADFTVSADGNVWFTNWLYQQGGVLVEFDQNRYLASVADSDEKYLPLHDFIEVLNLPPELLTPNGIVMTADGVIWLADTTSSSFFSFEPSLGEFIQYVTADPLPSTYGNQTGVIKSSPLSRPYWIEADDHGRIIFNAQTANNISVMDPQSQSLVEYHVPSKNPEWGDCDPGTSNMTTMSGDCGLAQIFDFTIHDEKVWFTEWAENNIGVVDTSIPLPLEIQLESDSLTLAPGSLQPFHFTVMPTSSQKDVMLDALLILSTTHEFLNVELVDDTPKAFQLNSSYPHLVQTNIHVAENAVSGTYKILLGTQLPEIAIGRFVTVTIN